MSLTVGTDSYITIAEAETYFEGYYSVTDERMVAWDELEESDKEIYLRRAFRCIETLPLRGCKYSVAQTTQFPRETSTVPQAVKDAQAELAISYLQIDSGVGIDADSIERKNLQAQGVTRIKIGKLEESYDLSKTSPKENTALSLSEPAQLYLGPWLRGGYDVYGMAKTKSLV